MNLEEFRKNESLDRHLTRLLIAMVRKNPNHEIRVPALEVMSVDQGYSVLEYLDEATGEIVIQYGAKGSWLLTVGPDQEQRRNLADQRIRKDSTLSQSPVKTDEELAEMEHRAELRAERLKELREQSLAWRMGKAPFSER